MDKKQYTCPSCGFKTFAEPPGSYDICKICGWEDDGVQLANPACGGGANKESLIEAQEEILKRYPLPILEAKGYERNPKWRPLTESEKAMYTK
jgi:anaerobic ribonucleoside-triphosphate reductase